MLLFSFCDLSVLNDQTLTRKLIYLSTPLASSHLSSLILLKNIPIFSKEMFVL